MHAVARPPAGPFVSLLFLLLSLSAAAPLLAEAGPAGDWQGVLRASGVELRLVFHIVEGEDGSLGATLDSLDQGALGIPAGEVSFEKGRLDIRVPSIGGRYRGELKEDGTLDGTWSQGGAVLPLDLERGAPEPLRRPQHPEPPFPYRQEEVRIENPSGGVTLAGTLTLPGGEGPFPAVVLLSGSGPQNRDEEIHEHRPFLVLADHLTRAGIAVVRYDDRGVGDSTGVFAAATIEDFASDAGAAVAFLEKRPEIGEIGLAGHSEGGLVATLVANRSEAVDFVILLAAPALPGSEILVGQSDRVFELQGLPAAFREQNARLLRQAYRQLTADDLDGLHETLRKLFSLQAPTLGGEALEGQLEAQMRQLTSPWFRHFTAYDPAADLARLEQPVLALFGGKDVQVLPGPNLDALRAALDGHPRATMLELPDLNHLFQTAETGSPAEYAQIEETFDPEALDRIRDWLLELGDRNREAGGEGENG